MLDWLYIFILRLRVKVLMRRWFNASRDYGVLSQEAQFWELRLMDVVHLLHEATDRKTHGHTN